MVIQYIIIMIYWENSMGKLKVKHPRIGPNAQRLTPAACWGCRTLPVCATPQIVASLPYTSGLQWFT